MQNVLTTMPSLSEEYRKSLEELEGLLFHCGYRTKAYHHPGVPLFNKLKPASQVQILQALRAYCEAIHDLGHLEYNTVDMSPLVWRFLLRLGVAPSKDLFETIRNEPYIQIYNTDEVQIFRSLRCFERCSFTLEELTTRSWYDLWERENIFYYALCGLVSKIICFIKPTRLNLDFPYHLVREVDSECHFEFKYKIKSVSVLTKQGKSQMAVLVEDWLY